MYFIYFWLQFVLSTDFTVPYYRNTVLYYRNTVLYYRNTVLYYGDEISIAFRWNLWNNLKWKSRGICLAQL